ncbi:MAG: hypothetical protein RIQ53_2872 [Pseudomonadota bacterium]|jgi:hypothetical protein
MTPEKLTQANSLQYRITLLRETIKGGADQFLVRDKVSGESLDVRLRPETRMQVRQAIMSDLQAQLRAVEAEFDAL